MPNHRLAKRRAKASKMMQMRPNRGKGVAPALLTRSRTSASQSLSLVYFQGAKQDTLILNSGMARCHGQSCHGRIISVVEPHP
jgi:hypothetical protein